MEDKSLNLDNSKLHSLIEEWLAEDGKGKTYENVVLELLNGNSSLFVQTLGEKVNETKTYITGENDKLKMRIFEIEGKKCFAAFTSLELLEKWLQSPGTYAQVPSKTFLEMADKTEIDAVILNSGYRNMFVVFRSSDAKKNGL